MNKKRGKDPLETPCTVLPMIHTYYQLASTPASYDSYRHSYTGASYKLTYWTANEDLQVMYINTT